MSGGGEVDLDRRRFLTASTAVVGGAGAVAAAAPFLLTFQPSARAIAAGAPVEVDISKLREGQRMVIEWRKKPVMIMNRPAEALAKLAGVDGELKDPGSENSEQPSYAQNTARAREARPEILVMALVCTHLGCSPKDFVEPQPDLGIPAGGFYCPCHGSKFDLAGRVYKSVPAASNMLVPPYKFLDDNRLLIGEDDGDVA